LQEIERLEPHEPEHEPEPDARPEGAEPVAAGANGAAKAAGGAR
jgi:hypothetical protein